MPDKPIHTKRINPLDRSPSAQACVGSKRQTHRHFYAELSCKSNFSFLRGASHPDELAQRAAELGYAAVALTDRNTLAGVVRMHCAAKACHLALLVGAEVTPIDAPAIALYATNRAGYGRLARLITQGRLRTSKGSCEIDLNDIAASAEGLIAAVLDWGLTAHSQTALGTYRDIFGDRLYVAVSVHGGSDDDQHLARMDALSRLAGVPMVATNDVHYHESKRRFLQDVVTCIRNRCTLHEAGRQLFANAERHLKSPEEMARLFTDHPEALARTVEIADRCDFSLDELQYEYPDTIYPKGRSPADFLAELTWAGAARRYPDGMPGKVKTLIEHELKLIRELDYERYFLTV